MFNTWIWDVRFLVDSIRYWGLSPVSWVKGHSNCILRPSFINQHCHRGRCLDALQNMPPMTNNSLRFQWCSKTRFRPMKPSFSYIFMLEPWKCGSFWTDETPYFGVVPIRKSLSYSEVQAARFPWNSSTKAWMQAANKSSGATGIGIIGGKFHGKNHGKSWNDPADWTTK